MEIKQAVLQVYRALEEKGYNPINQLVGYILSEDPTYITTYKNARAIIRRIDRDDLLQALVRDYVKGCTERQDSRRHTGVFFVANNDHAGNAANCVQALGRVRGLLLHVDPKGRRVRRRRARLLPSLHDQAKKAFCTALSTAARPAVKLTPPCR